MAAMPVIRFCKIMEKIRFLRLTLEKAVVKLTCRGIMDQYLTELEEKRGHGILR